MKKNYQEIFVNMGISTFFKKSGSLLLDLFEIYIPAVTFSIMFVVFVLQWFVGRQSSPLCHRGLESLPEGEALPSCQVAARSARACQVAPGQMPFGTLQRAR